MCKADFYVKSTDIFLLLCDILHLVIEGTRKKFTQIDFFNKLTYKIKREYIFREILSRGIV